MVDLITPQNINDVLNEVIKKLDEAEMILGCPGCSSDEVGEYRCEALSSIRVAHSTVDTLIHNSYKLNSKKHIVMTDVKMLREALKNGVVSFKYQKKDGSIREAKGTTNPDTVGENYTARGGFGPKDFGYVSYWDMDKNDWRCFDPDKFISAECDF